MLSRFTLVAFVLMSTLANAELLNHVEVSKFQIFSVLYSPRDNRALVGIRDPLSISATYANCDIVPSLGTFQNCQVGESRWFELDSGVMDQLAFQFEHNLKMGYQGLQLLADPTFSQAARSGFHLGFQGGILSGIGVKPAAIAVILSAELLARSPLGDGDIPVTASLPEAAAINLKRIFPNPGDAPVMVTLSDEDPLLSLELVEAATSRAIDQSKR